MRLLQLLFLALTCLFFLNSCEKESITRNFDQLDFSTDTVLFDTVFTSVGTATRNFRVYNKGNGTLRISSIRLANPNSQFRINVDGLSGTSFSEIDILPNDSIFIFVEATINPNGTNSPLVVTDSILFNIDGRQRDIDLVAWGQDANYIVADTYQEGLPPYVILPENAVWTNNKPYVVYGYALVFTDRSLTIEAGTKVHFHSGSGLWVYSGGNIKVNGTKDKQVIFQGDRLEPFYKDLPGQWDVIRVNEGSTDNVFNYAIIKNAILGIQAILNDSALDAQGRYSNNNLVLKNTIIQNHSAFGIFARNMKISGENLVVANAGQYCMGISGGGEFNFRHTTFANYFSQAVRSTPAFYMTNVYKINDIEQAPRLITNTNFVNCIFYGSEKDEFGFDIKPGNTSPSFLFENCLVKTKEAINSSSMVNTIYNQDPAFKNRFEHDWSILANSGARDKGKSGVGPDLDIAGTPRDAQPDLGAYEYK